MAADRPLPRTPAAWHRHIWQLTWPVILANITVPLVGAADVWVMGRIPDPAYIGSVALGATMFSSVYWLFGFLRMGTTGLTAQAYGALAVDGQPTELFAIMQRALLMAGGLGLLMVLLQYPLAEMLFAIFQPSGQVAEFARKYLVIRIWGAPAFLIYLVELGVLFGLQRMRETLILSIGLNITNLLLDLFFVLGLGMGVEGVAYGTLLSEWGAAIFGALLVWRALGPLRARLPAGMALLGGSLWRGSLWQGGAALRLVSVSSNLILRTFFVQLPFLAGTQLATGLSDVTLAAHGILMQLFFFMTYSLDGFAHTAETLTGYSYGARDRRALRTASIYCAWWAFALALFTAIVFYLTGPLLIDTFTLSSEVRAFAYDYIPWLALAPLFCTWAFLFDGIFIGTTHIMEMRNAMLISALLWALLLWLTFPSYQYHAVWLAMNAFMLLRGILLGLAYPRIERAIRPAAAT